MSDPKGPVYLWARREVMEEEVSEDFANAALDIKTWTPTEPIALSDDGWYKVLFSVYS